MFECLMNFLVLTYEMGSAIAKQNFFAMEDKKWPKNLKTDMNF